VASVKEMRAAARARGVKGYYKMNKTQLMQATGMGAERKAPKGDKRAQGIAKKSGAAVSFGAGKLASKYGVSKEALVKDARKALKQAQKAKGGALTPQEKRKAVAQSLSSATKGPRDTSLGGLFKEADRVGSKYQKKGDPIDMGAKRAAKKIYDESGMGGAIARAKGKSKGGLTAIDGGKSSGTKRQSMRSAARDLMKATGNTDKALGKLKEQKTAIEKKQSRKGKKSSEQKQSRTDELRAKFGDKSATLDRFRGRDSFKQASGVLRNRPAQTADRVNGAIRRSEGDVVDKALNRRARKLGKDVAIRRNFNYDSTGREPEVVNTRFSGSAKKGGDDSTRKAAQEFKRSSAKMNEQRMADRLNQTVNPNRKAKLKRSASGQTIRQAAKRSGAFYTARNRQKNKRFDQSFGRFFE
jgi:hypothetical protein